MPAYLHTINQGLLDKKINEARALLAKCSLCPHHCAVNRLTDSSGLCRTGAFAKVCSHHSHPGEERVISGTNGSGTIFFSYCNLMCSFCQNYTISHEGEGEEVSAARLAEMMLTLQKLGCHNINLVTPSHVVPQILSALQLAAQGGLKLPLIYNSSGYDSVETLRLLDGVIDIYMPDFKFWDGGLAASVTNASDYPEVVRQALKEMHRQVGNLVLDSEGIAARGLLVRHLVLPGGRAQTRDIMAFLAKEISPNTCVNLMDQYWPAGEASRLPGFSHQVSTAEYEDALKAAREEGISRFIY